MLDLDFIFDPVIVEAAAQAKYGTAVQADDLPADWRGWFEERAAIMEYEGGLPRARADAEALAETVRLMGKEKMKMVLDYRTI